MAVLLRELHIAVADYADGTKRRGIAVHCGAECAVCTDAKRSVDNALEALKVFDERVFQHRANLLQRLDELAQSDGCDCRAHCQDLKGCKLK